MPISYHIDSDRGLIVFRHLGTVPDEQLLDALQELLHDPRFNPEFTKILDLSKTDSEARTNEGIQKGASLLKEVHAKAKPSKLAIIAPKDLSYGLSRVLEGKLYESNMEVKVFRTAEEATTWLNLNLQDLVFEEDGH